MTSLPKAYQTRLAEFCAASPQGATLLLELVQTGKGPARLLAVPSVEPLLAKNLSETQHEIRAQLVATLPSEDDALDKLITQRIQRYRDHGGSASAGQVLFQNHCTVCHQLGGAGTVLGPNLDGIGNRGLARLTEDVLNPNRNVDIAFRLTTVVLKDGSTQVGLIKRTEGTQTILADPTGKESSILTDNIASTTALTLSLMPAAFAEALTKREFRDLQAYLLSLRN